MIPQSELILNPDGSIYHLQAKPGQLAERIITVGDQERVDLFERHFQKIDTRITNREFRIITGTVRGERISVLSTGIGTDNIDIAINEIDALFNIDFEKRTVKDDKTILHFIRVGTSGAIRPEIKIDSFIRSSSAIGFDGLMHFYDSSHVRNLALEGIIRSHMKMYTLYAIDASSHLLDHFDSIGKEGITITAPGFYAPQSRKLRLDFSFDIIKSVLEIELENQAITNLEMETAGIYGLARMLGHEAISLNAILANRYTGEFSDKPSSTINHLVEQALELALKI